MQFHPVGNIPILCSEVSWIIPEDANLHRFISEIKSETIYYNLFKNFNKVIIP